MLGIPVGRNVRVDLLENSSLVFEEVSRGIFVVVKDRLNQRERELLTLETAISEFNACLNLGIDVTLILLGSDGGQEVITTIKSINI